MLVYLQLVLHLSFALYVALQCGGGGDAAADDKKPAGTDPSSSSNAQKPAAPAAGAAPGAAGAPGEDAKAKEKEQIKKAIQAGQLRPADDFETVNECKSNWDQAKGEEKK